MSTVLVPGKIYSVLVCVWRLYPVGTPTLCLSITPDRIAKGHTAFNVLWPDGCINHFYMKDATIESIFIPIENFKQSV